MSDKPRFPHDGSVDGEMKRPAPGHWSWFEDKLAVRLPCGHVADITGHIVRADGEVEPSVVCAYSDYHANIYLDGWSHGEKNFGDGLAALNRWKS